MSVTKKEREAQLKLKQERTPLWLNLPAGLAHMAWAMFDGFNKYGIASFRRPDVEIKALDMLGAAERHIQKLKDREDFDPVSGAHHAGHAMACLSIYLDCMELGKLVDNRPLAGPVHVFDWRPNRKDAA
jgi:hypothetical protein